MTAYLLTYESMQAAAIRMCTQSCNYYETHGLQRSQDELSDDMEYYGRTDQII